MPENLSTDAQPEKASNVLPDWVNKLGSVLRILAVVSPGLAAKIMAIIWFKPFMSEPKKHVIDWQNSAQQKIDISLGQAFLFRNEDHIDEQQPLVVCVHGWRGRAHQMRRFVPELLELGFRVVVVNLPAHSGQGRNYTHIFEGANMLQEIQKSVGPIDSVIAHSFGSPVTTFALNENLQLRKFIMVAPNIDFRYLLNNYAKSFGLQKLIPKIEEDIKQHCDQKIFLGSWDKLTMETLQEHLMHVEEVQIWHDVLDTEINIEINQILVQSLLERKQAAKIIEVQDVGHFNILKDQDTVAGICRSLMKEV